jgi:CRISPR-associated protein Csb3
VAEASIPVDLFNPGQVFACLGFMEAADKLLGDAEAAFDWTAAETRFVLRARDAMSPFEAVLRFLDVAEVIAEAPGESVNVTSWLHGWGAIETLPPGAPYPYSDPPSPATLRAVLRAGDRRIEIDHWGDETRRDATKFWAGAGGYPGAALTRDALALVRSRCVAAASDPFALAVPQSSSFRLDWRRDYIPIDAGFSLNEHGGRIQTVGYPLVELLGAIGLSHARPKRGETKLEYRYAAVGRTRRITFLPPPIVRAALGGASLPFPLRRFRMSLGWPGKEGQARAITTVTEECSA